MKESLTVGQAGEQGVIAAILPYLSPRSAELPVAAGDDCAVVNRNTDFPLQVVTTDLLVEGTHFLRREDTNWQLLGRRAMVANLSDLASMGAVPSCALVSIGLPADFALRDLIALYRGLRMECDAWQTLLVGGDTVRSSSLVINVAITGGKKPTDAPCLRSGCKPGQNVYVSGALGGCRAGLELQINQERAQIAREPFAAALLDRQQLPRPRIGLGRQLAVHCPDVAMIDISDGLNNELYMLATSSGVGISIDIDLVPLWPGVREFCVAAGEEPAIFSLFSGEEYELLFATHLPEEKVRDLAAKERVQTEISRIGVVTLGKEVVFTRSGQIVHVPDQGYRHFAG